MSQDRLGGRGAAAPADFPEPVAPAVRLHGRSGPLCTISPPGPVDSRERTAGAS